MNEPKELSMDEALSFFRRRIGVLESRIIDYTAFSLAAMTMGFVNVDLKSERLKKSSMELSKLYFEYGIEFGGIEGIAYMVKALDISPDFRPSKVVEFYDDAKLKIAISNNDVGTDLNMQILYVERTDEVMKAIDATLPLLKKLSIFGN